LAGVVLGIGVAVGVEKLADIQILISSYSVLLAFGVAISVGLIFGILPARRAAHANPIESLRYE
jgi:putative ABC transport system permease protein